MATRLEAILHTKHRLDAQLLRALDDEDVRDLTAIALGERDAPWRVPAMNALAAARGLEAVPVIVRVIADAGASADDRAAAASLLGRLGGSEAERALVLALEDPPQPTLVRIKLAAALGRVGGASAIGVLRRLAETSEGAALEQARFSMSEIAYRLGMPDHPLPTPPRGALLEAPAEGAAVLRLEPASPESLAHALASLGADAHGLRLSPAVGWTVTCGASQLLAALDAELSSSLPAALSGPPRLLGLVAERAPSDGSYSTKWLIFSWPADSGRFHFAVHRPSGRQMFYGTGTSIDSESTFELRAVAGPGAAAVLVRGRAAGDHLHLEVAMVGAARARPSPIPLR